MENTSLRLRWRRPALPRSDPAHTRHEGGIASGSFLRRTSTWIWIARFKLGLGLLILILCYQFIKDSSQLFIEGKGQLQAPIVNSKSSPEQEQAWQQICEASRRDNMHRPPPSSSSNNNTHSLRHETKSDLPEKSNVVACTIAIHEQPYLTEWAEYNLHVLNIAKLYIYDNADNLELSNWTVDSASMSIGRKGESGQNGTNNTNNRESSRISITHYPGRKQQGPAYKDCARRALSEGYEYAFFTDVDEFLVLYQHNSIMELAVDYLGKGDEDVHVDVEVDKDRKIRGASSDPPPTPFQTDRNETRIVGSLGMNFRTLGNNCDIEYKDLPVSKRFQYRVESSYPMNVFIKSLVNLKWLDLDVDFTDPHFYKLRKDDNGKQAVKIDTNRQVRGGSLQPMRLYDVAAVHHFLHKSLSEYRKKRDRGGGTTGPSMLLIENAKKGLDNHGKPLPGGNIYDDEVWKRLVEKVPSYKKYDA